MRKHRKKTVISVTWFQEGKTEWAMKADARKYYTSKKIQN